MKKAIFWIVLMLLLISMLASTFITQPVKAESKIVSKTFSDDFSQDTGMWEYLGFAWPSYWGEDAKYVAYRDAEKGHVVLTPAEPHLAGAIWFKWEFTSPFTVNFKYLAGGGSGADGLVMMFYHEKPPYLWSGACLSFIGSGYGIEFDNHYNYLEDEYGGPPVTDPSENHIAIIKDNPSNHLIYVDDQRTEDNVWHSVTVDVDYSSITVYVDSQQVIQWQGTIDRTYGGFGFAGTTGSLTNQHLIDDFSILLPAKFKIGDWVQTTAQLNVREGPGLSYAIISTMPTGTLGRIVDGPLYGDGYVWWKVHYFMDYVSVVEGWSAENWLELYTLPICDVKLQKDGIEIDKVNVWEFFDIYVGGSSGDKPIKAVRFSSDDIQDGIPTGEWTDWYGWDASSGDWDAGTKIKRWAFATPGYKEVWAEVRDELGHATAGSAKIFVPAPALPLLISPLVITPTKNIYNVGDVLEAEFTIKNVGDKPITLDKLLVGGRFNGGKLPNGEFPDFTLQTSITLQPGQSYQYKGSLTLTQTGNYHSFVAYYIENPTAEEKKLLDENNWNTNIELGEGLSHKDRVRDIIVLEEVDLLKLEEAINRWGKVLTTYQYPPNLLDDKSFTGRVSKVWASFTSFITRTQLTEKYKELYSTGVEYHRLSYQALMDAKNCLEKGDVEGAGKYLQRSYTYGRLAAMSFSSAAEVYEASLEAGEILARGIRDGCEAAVKIGVSVLYPPAASKVDLFYSVYDWAIDAMIEGWEKATKELVAEKIAEVILKMFVFRSFDYNTFQDYVNLRAVHIPIDEILTNEEFLEELGCEKLYDVLQEKLWKEVRIELTLPMFKKVTEYVVDRFLSFVNSIIFKGKSPIELRVIDSEGRITGVVNGVVKHEVPMSYYYNGTITIYYLAEPYLYEVAGIEEGHYSLEITLTKEGTVTTFQATDISTSQNVLHQYTVNWTALSMGEEGVTVQVDSDGDGFFEKTFVSDSKLTYKEFMFPTKATFTFNALWEGVNYPVIVSSSNSTIAEFNFYQSLKQISFKVSGETGTSGYCNVTIPKNLLKGEPWMVRLNGTDWTFTATQNETHSFLYFTYTHSSTYEVTIQGTWAIPEFPSTTILLTFVLNTLTAIILLRKKRKTKGCIKL